MKKNIKKFTINFNKTIRDALKLINKNTCKTCLVLDSNDCIYGSVTDGDIRRKILKNSKILNEKLKNYCNKKMIYLKDKDYKIAKARKLIKKKKIEIIPIVNKNKQIIKVLLKSDLDSNKKKKIKKDNSLKNIKVVIMAGGKGKRLDPITKIFPKPLVPINDKTAIENILGNFSKFGVRNFYLILNYKAELIKAFFKSKNNFSQNISYVEEKKPLGTAGGLEKIKKKIKNPFLVTNCDVFFNFNIKKLIEYHNKNRCDLTLVVSNQISILPYGVCEIDKDLNFTNIKEKPKFKHLITTGLYLINPSLLKMLPKNKFYDMNTFIEIVNKKNFKIGTFKIGKNNWYDVGQLRDYKKNIRLLTL